MMAYVCAPYEGCSETNLTKGHLDTAQKMQSLKMSFQIGRFFGPKTLQIGEF